MRDPIHIAFNPDTMTVRDLKACATTLRGLLQDFDRHYDDPEEFWSRFLQITDAYTVED